MVDFGCGELVKPLCSWFHHFKIYKKKKETNSEIILVGLCEIFNLLQGDIMWKKTKKEINWKCLISPETEELISLMLQNVSPLALDFKAVH